VAQTPAHSWTTILAGRFNGCWTRADGHDRCGFREHAAMAAVSRRAAKVCVAQTGTFLVSGGRGRCVGGHKWGLTCARVLPRAIGGDEQSGAGHRGDYNNSDALVQIRLYRAAGSHTVGRRGPTVVPQRRFRC